MKSKDFFKSFETARSVGVKTVITVTDHIDDSYLQEGMMGEVIDMNDKGDYYEVYIDLESFESHNDKFDKKIWYDRNGWPSLTGKEAGFYPRDHVELIYIDPNQDVPFKVVEKTDFLTELFELYLKDDIEKGIYNEWLENVIEKLTDGNVDAIKEILK
jgi:hypothetical protein